MVREKAALNLCPLLPLRTCRYFLLLLEFQFMVLEVLMEWSDFNFRGLSEIFSNIKQFIWFFFWHACRSGHSV